MNYVVINLLNWTTQLPHLTSALVISSRAAFANAKRQEPFLRQIL